MGKRKNKEIAQLTNSNFYLMIAVASLTNLPACPASYWRFRLQVLPLKPSFEGGPERVVEPI